MARDAIDGLRAKGICVMEISDVRRRVLETIDTREEIGGRAARARRRGDARLRRVPRSRGVPLFRQVANVLRAEGYHVQRLHAGGSVRLMSDRTAEDYIELALDTAGDQPRVIGHASRARGRRVIESERPIAERPPAELTEEDVLAFVLKELEPFVER